MKRWREQSATRREARQVRIRNHRMAAQIRERAAVADVEQLPEEPPGVTVEFQDGLLPPPAPVIMINAVRHLTEHLGWPLADAVRNATQVLGLLLAVTVASGCVPARQRPPGVAPVELLEGSGIDTAGAEPDDRGSPQPLWPGVPRVLIVQTREEPPDPPPSPPSAAREICSPWWRTWLAQLAVEHGVAVDAPGWFEVARPPPAASDTWWAAWLRQELDRCASTEPETPTAPEGSTTWLGY